MFENNQAGRTLCVVVLSVEKWLISDKICKYRKYMYKVEMRRVNEVANSIIYRPFPEFNELLCIANFKD